MLSTSYYLVAVAVALKIYLSSSRKKKKTARLCRQNYLYEISITYT